MAAVGDHPDKMYIKYALVNPAERSKQAAAKYSYCITHDR